MSKCTPPKLNGKTPKWFYDWHTKFYEARMSRNERLIYLTIGIVVASGIATSIDLVGIVRALVGG